MPNQTLAVALASLLSTAANAATPRDLGDRGVLVPLGTFALTYTKTDDSTTASGRTLTTVVFAPGLLYFVIDDLAVGGNLVLASSSVGDGTPARTTVGLGPEVAYHVRFTEMWSLLPSVSLDLTRDAVPNGPTTTADITNLAVSLYVPVLLRVSHFYMGFGPTFSRDLYAHATVQGTGLDVAPNTRIGISTTLGGWL